MLYRAEITVGCKIHISSWRPNEQLLTLHTLLNTYNLLNVPFEVLLYTALQKNNSTDVLSQQSNRKPEFTLFLCLSIVRTNAEFFGVCIIPLFAVSKTVKLRERGIIYKLFHSCVQISFEAFSDPINTPL